MENGRIPKDLSLWELQMGKRSRGWPVFQYRDVCKWDMQNTNMDLVPWEQDAIDRIAWRGMIRNGIVVNKKMLANRFEAKRQRRHIRLEDPTAARIPYTY
jgi:hypothetical protein